MKEKIINLKYVVRNIVPIYDQKTFSFEVKIGDEWIKFSHPCGNWCCSVDRNTTVSIGFWDIYFAHNGRYFAEDNYDFSKCKPAE